MACSQRLGMLVILLSLVSTSAVVLSDEDDLRHCESIVRKWAESSKDNGLKEDKLALKDLLFFLHVPRTGGRTYFHCFLRKLYTNDQECPRSYDKLRFDPSKPNCRLMVTHDDYSLMSKLPKERTSVVTILRNPIDRIFSTYEFSIEVAARFLVHPNLTSATHMSGRMWRKSRGVSTLDIWPWKYLVPWMREDLFARRDVRKAMNRNQIKNISNPYDMEDIVMPLHAFINDPMAQEIIHNGATFQVAGLTNNSYLDESHEVRHCVRRYPSLGRHVIEVAKNRLDHMLYVGLTEDHKESATMFASMVGAQVLSQSEALSSHVEQEESNTTDVSSVQDHQADEVKMDKRSIDSEQAGGGPADDAVTTNQNMTAGKLMDAYEACISSLRKSQATRRAMSLKRIAPANFSKEARLSVPEVLLQEILSLNSLDVELYKHAQDIFLQQQKHLMENNEDILIDLQHKHLLSEADTLEMHIALYGLSPWKVFLLSISALLFLALIFLIVTARKRTYKLKI